MLQSWTGLHIMLYRLKTSLFGKDPYKNHTIIISMEINNYYINIVTPYQKSYCTIFTIRFYSNIAALIFMIIIILQFYSPYRFLYLLVGQNIIHYIL